MCGATRIIYYILTYLSTTIPFLKQITAGRTCIFSFATKNFAFSTLIFENLVSKYLSESDWKKKIIYKYTET